jgi:hypothetical protein
LEVELSFGFFGHEVGTDEGIEVAVEDAVHVADIEFCAVILNEAVGLHHIGADLAAEGNVEFGFVELIRVRLTLLDFEIVEPRAEHLHRELAILALTALGLACDNNVCREVGDAHGGFDLVYVLAALAAGAEGVHAEVFRANIDFDAVVDFRNDEDGGEGGVAARGLIERRDSNEAVDAGFAGEQAVGIFAGELNGRGLDAGLFAGSLVKDLRAHVFALCPTEIHAKEDGSPVLRFGAACAGLNGHDGVEVVVFAGEERLGFEFGDVSVGSGKFAVELSQQVIFLLCVSFFQREIDVRLDIAGGGSELSVGGNLLFGTFALAENALRGFLIAPEIGFGDASFEGFQALAIQWGVKDSSARA